MADRNHGEKQTIQRGTEVNIRSNDGMDDCLWEGVLAGTVSPATILVMSNSSQHDDQTIERLTSKRINQDNPPQSGSFEDLGFIVDTKRVAISSSEEKTSQDPSFPGKAATILHAERNQASQLEMFLMHLLQEKMMMMMISPHVIVTLISDSCCGHDRNIIASSHHVGDGEHSLISLSTKAQGSTEKHSDRDKNSPSLQSPLTTSSSCILHDDADPHNNNINTNRGHIIPIGTKIPAEECKKKTFSALSPCLFDLASDRQDQSQNANLRNEKQFIQLDAKNNDPDCRTMNPLIVVPAPEGQESCRNNNILMLESSTSSLGMQSPAQNDQSTKSPTSVMEVFLHWDSMMIPSSSPLDTEKVIALANLETTTTTTSQPDEDPNPDQDGALWMPRCVDTHTATHTP